MKINIPPEAETFLGVLKKITMTPILLVVV